MKLGMILRKTLVFGVLLGLGNCLLLAAAIIVDGLTDEQHPADVAVVLGNRVEPDGRLSPRLQARLDQAVVLYRTGLVGDLVVSGGIEQEGTDEAAAMRRYLIAQGIPAGHIQSDNGGFNTYLTALNVSRMMEERGSKSVIVVSQFYHISRSKLAFRRFGVSPVYGSHARYLEWRDPYAIAREVAATVFYLLRPYD